jgi:hypothetical protein
MIATFDCHGIFIVQASLMIVTYDYHSFNSTGFNLQLSLMIVIVFFVVQSSLTIATYDCHGIFYSTGFTYDRHLQLS